MRGLRNRAGSVDGFCGNNSVIAAGQLLRFGGCIQARGEFGCSRELEAVLSDGLDVFFPDVIGPNLHFTGPSQVRSKEAAYSTTADNANLHAGSWIAEAKVNQRLGPLLCLR